MEEGKDHAEKLIEASEPKKYEVKIKKKSPWMISTIVLGLAVIVLLVFMFRGGITGIVINEGDATEKLIDYLDTIASGGVTFVSSEDVGSLYKIMVSYQGDKIPVYITKDGEYFVQGVVPLTGQVTQPTQQQTPQDIPKSDKPKVELFVMSFCPYGNRAEDTMLPAYNLLKDKVDWNINYIVSVSGDTIRSLHGQPETDQNIREVCVKKEYGLDKFWEFTTYVNQNCGRDGSCWEDAAKEAKISISKIQSCFDEEGLDLMKTEARISGDAGASGSPTLLINGVNSRAVYQYENPEAYKQAICSAFNDAPEECDEVLEGSSSGSSSGGSC